ncbi:MAG: tetratricopeptide repeat protein [Ferruginibacter sp.]
MKWKLLLVTCISFCNASNVLAQKKIDSLLAVLKTRNTGTDAGLLQQIAAEYKNQYKYTKSIEYYEKVLELANEKGGQELISSTYKNISDLYNLNNEFNKAITEARNALQNVNKSDSIKLTGIYQGLSFAFMNLSINDSILFYTNKALEINKIIKNNTGLAENYFILGKVEVLKGNNKLSLDHYEKALYFIRKTSNKRFEAQALNNQSAVYAIMNNYSRAIEILFEAISIGLKNNFKDLLAVNYCFLSENYMHLGKLDIAFEYLEKAQTIYEEIGVTGGNLALLYSDYGIFYDAKKEHEKALEYKEKAVAINEKAEHNSGLTTNYTNIGVSWHFLGQYIPAMSYYQKALALSEKLDQSYNTSVVLNNKGEVYRDAPDSILQVLKIKPADRYKLSLATFDESLSIATRIGTLDIQMTVWENKSILYEQQHDYINALSAYKNFIAIKEKMLNNQTKQKINRLEIQNEYNKKEDSIKLEQAVTNTQLQQQQFLNRQQSQDLLLQRNKLLLSQQQLSLSNKEKDLQHLAFLKTQADLQTEQLQKSEQEKRLTIIQKEKALQAAQVITLSQENDLNKLKGRQQLLYGISGLALLLFTGLYLLNRNRHKQEQLQAALAKEKAEQQQKEAEFQRSLADVSLSALRSQMNPHFIFNCLNSIKLYTTQNDTVAAATYLTKFSKLIRMALENSRSETVSLESELESLDLYIQMEAMRFKNKLKYIITVDKDVDSGFIEIPPLLLQPYVENAIWHGLMHKEEGGVIEVAVSVMPGEQVLSITIKDDGVGRERSAILSGGSTGNHRSYGTKVTSERLELINQVYKTGASVITEDVKDSSGKVAGTLVTIKIPFE